MISIQERLGIDTEPIAGAAWQWACALRCAIPAKVISFDPVKQTCVVQPLIQEVVMKPAAGSTNTTANVATPETIYPLADVLIIMMRVPGWSLTFPIVAGTECLLIFADMCIDGWWQSGQVSPQFDRRRHDLSDAIALFGPWSQPHLLNDYSTTSVQLRSDDLSVVLDLAPGVVTITAPTVDVNGSGTVTVAAATVDLNASAAINLVAPAITMKNSGGTATALMTEAFLTWFTTNITPFLISKGYAGPAPPTGSITSVLDGE